MSTLTDSVPGSGLSRLRAFLRLFDKETRRSLAIMGLATAFLSATEFVLLLVLYPVFVILATGSRPDGATPFAFVDTLSTTTLIVVSMALLAARSLAAFSSRVWWLGNSSAAESRLAGRLLGAYAYAPFPFHQRTNSSELAVKTITNVAHTCLSGLNGFVLLTSDLVTTFAVAAALVVADPQAAFSVFAYLGTLGAAFTVASRRLVRRETANFSRHLAKTHSKSATLLRGIRELTVADARDQALSSVRQSRDEMVKAQKRLLLLGEAPRVILEVALYLAMLTTLIFVLRTDSRADALSLLALYAFAGMRVLPSIARSLTTLTNMRTGIEMGLDIKTEIETAERLRNAEGLAAGPLPDRAVLTLEDLSFSYVPGLPILDRLHLEVPFGSSVGIVGESGGGKSTLLGLMLGLLAPQEGLIRYGDSPIGVADAAWHSRVAFVPQDPFIIDDTVLANVALGDHSPDEGRAMEALDRAHLLQDIACLPEGVHTTLAEGGANLSLGQRQRLGIARALYRNAQVMLLDEPTASLDSTTESNVVQTLAELKGLVTMVTVSHRDAALKHADVVYRLAEGVLAQDRTAS